MKNFRQILLWAALLMAGAALTACMNKILPEKQSAVTYTLRVDAAKGAAAPDTRALTDEGTTLAATWNTTDVVEVYKGTEKVGTLTPDKAASTAILSGEVCNVAVDDELTLAFGTPDKYDTQDGTLEYIDANCNYAEATIQVTNIENNVVSTTAADFVNAQSITKFTFSKSVKSVTIGGGATDIKVTLDTPGTVAYVAMPGTTDLKTYTFDAYDDDGILMCGTKSATLANGKFYTADVRLIAGGVDLVSVNPWDITGVLTYHIPAEKRIKSATLVVNIYSGSGADTYGAKSTVSLLAGETETVIAEESLWLEGNYVNDPDSHPVPSAYGTITKCYSDYQMIYDVKTYLQSLADTDISFNVTNSKLDSYNLDARIKMIALVVVFDGGKNDSFTCWMDLTQRWTQNNVTTTFPTSSYTGNLLHAQLYNITLSSNLGNPYTLNNNNLGDPSVLKSGNYYQYMEWDVTNNYIKTGENTVFCATASNQNYGSLKNVLTLLVFEKE